MVRSKLIGGLVLSKVYGFVHLFFTLCMIIILLHDERCDRSIGGAMVRGFGKYLVPIDDCMCLSDSSQGLKV